ncbi:aldehyde dehydrogenase family protein [Cytophagaceae bacterium DM2B3-1]|uniref:Aldehyde dehydrogenase n=1 Tax=Xanthocytophaga flava TaxID=3048013 RepID=A0ABT7CNA9_9BACT|nr:aldehyde dehydrogenase family protein [Xanthocytophaga flavus]MDJ1495224.1 aldehyde dehydrogenase family protein [Xanthocytophaga flavus]
METEALTSDHQVFEDQLLPIFEQQKAYAQALLISSVEQRKEKLKRLRQWILSNRIAIQEALSRDFHKPVFETDITEIYSTKTELDHALGQLHKWMRPAKVGTPLVLIGTRSRVMYEPKGVALIIAPWNYPFYLLVSPLISAIAAGCCAILKPSEMTPATTSLVKRMVAELFESREVTVVEGDATVATALLKLPFDHIFFTGSPQIGKVVMRAAAEHLTSVTLELGGKSPCIVDATANIKDAAEKIAIGKFLNAGQTCIAPDYILVHKSKEKELVQTIQAVITQFYGADPETSPDLAHIINSRHLNRLQGLISDAVAKGATLVVGGKANAETRYLAPTLLTGVTPDMQVMQEEIFGPVLPVLTFEHIHEVTHFVTERSKPLALYIFSQDQQQIDYVLKHTTAGGVSVNECLMHVLHPDLPFGGVNTSGIGKSHGFYGFVAFSNEKAVLHQRVGLTNYKQFYPPYTQKVKKLFNLLLQWL